MLANSTTTWITNIGWLGVLTFPVILIGYLITAHATARWAFGPTPSRGQRLVAALAMAAVLLGAGALMRFGAADEDGGMPRRLEQAGWGAVWGLAIGVWLILLSVRRADTRTDPAVISTPALPPSSRATASPKGVHLFHAVVIGFVAAAFTAFGVIAVVVAAYGFEQSGMFVFGLFGILAIVVGLGLSRLAWRIGRRGSGPRPT